MTREERFQVLGLMGAAAAITPYVRTSPDADETLDSLKDALQDTAEMLGGPIRVRTLLRAVEVLVATESNEDYLARLKKQLAQAEEQTVKLKKEIAELEAHGYKAS